jgi:hypothetical protein
MDVEVFAGVAVSDLPRAASWFDRLLGDVKLFEPNDTERVWTLGSTATFTRSCSPSMPGTPW